jgi:ApbE superfamily uncharacterized protein (UPF0280 family)
MNKTMPGYVDRFYRRWVASPDLVTFEVQCGESDILISADNLLKDKAMSKLNSIREGLQKYIAQDPEFKTSLRPHKLKDEAPEVAKIMAQAAGIYSVGPMAAVAGAIAESLGRFLLTDSETVILENGGDIFARSLRPLRFSLFAGRTSPFSKLVCEIKAKEGMGICTSSGKIGPSISFGRADAVVAVARDTALADAAATAIANKINCVEDVERISTEELTKDMLEALIICLDDKIAIWGDIEIR